MRKATEHRRETNKHYTMREQALEEQVRMALTNFQVCARQREGRVFAFPYLEIPDEIIDYEVVPF